ncbi:16S rRNA (guanine(527)-N(7))-methyltransferase RsmG [Candidatus Marinamargulisbacteria bacterium SCGC AG-343-D04]|nr:16S rRNA (guanine(527)-N(7))-methyltransferase RsmG [Candidatus Marinamargulisbacteria bacterium SCGC AG-343-D04]
MNEKIETYISLLKEYNTHTNIYSEKAYDHLDFHIQDSTTLAHHIENKIQNIFDFGSGSGLPAIPIAITNPKNTVFAIESKSRKTRFLHQVKEELHLKNLQIITQNVFEWKPQSSPHIITAKAFGPLDKIKRICKHLKIKNATIITPISLKQKEALSDSKDVHCININTFHYAKMRT